ncbi:MAG: hypothetical protein CMJ78_24320 [Planctomycetaceae bacterium]|nr:hypothetical protein [Planctomycetaceae bacterium]
MELLPRYDIHQSYLWNYDHAPELQDRPVAAIPGSWKFCGLPVDSPLGMPAGPLLNGRWILYYAGLGFDVLTYKTVRSVERACYELPNLQPVVTRQLNGSESELPATSDIEQSWAVSFGMPSKVPDEWRVDVEWTRDQLPTGKLLNVSVVASVQPDWSLEDLADDYAQCARWAIDSGADTVETNFSCPNVSTCDGQLYQQPESAGVVAQRVRDRIGQTPYIAKIGHVYDSESAGRLLDALAPYVDALAMTNSVAATVRGTDGELLFEGQSRGICGEATRTASTAQTKTFRKLIEQRGDDVRLIGVGGASTAEHVWDYLLAGAESVHIATAAMQDPLVGCRIREDLASRVENEGPPSPQ